MSVSLVLIIGFGVIFFHNFGFYRVMGTSMESVLRDNDLALVRYQENFIPQRGDVILIDYVVGSPQIEAKDEASPIFQSEKDHVLMLRRVIGLPGEVVEIKQNKIWINGEELKEPYIHQGKIDDVGPYHIPKDHVFVTGDNYNNSSFVPVELSQVKGTLVTNWHMD